MSDLPMVNASDAVMTAPPALKQGEMKLQTLVDSKCMSEEGKSWFTAATDPFHDEKVSLQGYPDNIVAMSVVQCVKQQVAISCPGALTGGNWDCNVVMWPHAENSFSASTPSQYHTGVAYAGGTFTQFSIGGVTALASASGNGTYGSANATYDIIVNGSGNVIDASSYLQGSSRVVAMGLEVVNTTAPLYKQGLVTAWRMPCPKPDNPTVLTWATTNAALYFNCGAYVMPIPPGTVAAATLLGGSQSWEAEKGGYVVNTMNGLDNIPKQPQSVLAMCTAFELPDNGTGVLNSMADTLTNISVGSGGVLTPNLRHITPFNMSGLYFSGLSPQSTLQIRSVYYVERFPAPSDNDLVVLSTPSPSFDPCALELYSRTLAELPVGVPSGMNPLGEWFKDVVKKVTNFTTPILKTLAPVNPLLGGLAMVSQGAGAAARGNSRKAAKAVNNVVRTARGKTPKKKRKKKRDVLTLTERVRS